VPGDSAAPVARLLEEVRACSLCAAQLPLGPRPVLQLHPSARLLIAGQAPGRKVHASGIPFDDASGDRLRAWLGVSREEFYDPTRVAILPMGFCYPGTGRAGDLPPRPECAPAWRARLLATLRHLELTLAIGRYAVAYHLPGDRASLADVVRRTGHRDAEIVALPHPSPRNQRWLSQHPWFERDLLPPLRQRIRGLVA
jgi:uracil-DNA glycosylase